MTRTCSACGESTPDGASFCEACGSDLDPTPTQRCVQCAAVGQIESGYCLVCGHKQPAPRDHIEIDLDVIAAVTDRGNRHHNNEDAVAIAVFDGGAAIVVCDGVSTTDNPEAASLGAVEAALPVLIEAGANRSDPRHAMAAAAAQAQDAVVAIPPNADGQGNPSCTFVAALVLGDAVTVGWLGDSRAYWLGPEPQQLTIDHSWALEMAASQVMTLEAASADPRATTITRWLGADALDTEPEIAEFTFQHPGTLLLCSDGLWNYAPEPGELASHAAIVKPRLVDQAAGLTDFAKLSGGHDNITVALAHVGPVATLGIDAT